MTPRQTLSKFYADNNLGADGGLSSKSVKIEVTKNFYFWFPNFDARRKAVLKHDIHHLVTGYTTSFSGECEISMWEIASGCKKYWAALLIDTNGVTLGLLINFRKIIRAFARGRRTKNLYHDFFTNEEALDMEIATLQQKLQLDRFPKNTSVTFGDFVLFLLFLIPAGIFSILSIALLPAVGFYSVFMALKNRG